MNRVKKNKSRVQRFTEWTTGISFINSSEKKLLLEEFLLLLKSYGEKINLFSNKTSVEKHLKDCLLGLEIILNQMPFEDFFKNKKKVIYDFGSGNGFPGVVAGILRPENKFVLVERNQKKAQFLKKVVEKLEIGNLEVFCGQARSLGPSSVHWGMSRAMAPFPRFLNEIKKVTAQDGQIFLFKGKNWQKEITACSPKTLKFWEIKKVDTYTFEDKKFFIISCFPV